MDLPFLQMMFRSGAKWMQDSRRSKKLQKKKTRQDDIAVGFSELLVNPGKFNCSSFNQQWGVPPKTS
jgi:hypothetical protein